jgi:hypothetical protein
MIERAIDLQEVLTILFFLADIHEACQALDTFLESQEFSELHKFQLSDSDWDAPQVFQPILEVCLSFHHWLQNISLLSDPTCISANFITREDSNLVSCHSSI